MRRPYNRIVTARALDVPFHNWAPWWGLNRNDGGNTSREPKNVGIGPDQGTPVVGTVLKKYRRGEACLARQRSMAPTAPHVSAVAIVGCRDCRAGIKIGGLGQQDPKTIAMRETHQPERPRRRSIRLPDYDYSQVGAYFVTICTWKWICLFGDIINTRNVFERFGNGWPRKDGRISPNIFRAVDDRCIRRDAQSWAPWHHRHYRRSPGGNARCPPLQYPPSGADPRDLSAPSSVPTNRRYPNASTRSAAPRANRSGNAIITNRSFSMRTMPKPRPSIHFR